METTRTPVLLVLLNVLALCAGGCATNSEISHVPADMKVATADTVGNCRLIGDVHGVSSSYGLFAGAGLSKARQQAFTQARALGANTVVWGQFETPYGSTSVSALAYACPL
jgi:hypothetical protein